ncbi:hypothetical protein PHET_11141 [Paragonimus heterotremus]|uniref:Uncharacterized protein n=1 Tax=Paragonimus heterotremus TaxID=100268 RepID=A0A8J4SYS2_9TREM|nr:hypothetical protein PHET_11141 [Paragonimus heterotremus]
MHSVRNSTDKDIKDLSDVPGLILSDEARGASPVVHLRRASHSRQRSSSNKRMDRQQSHVPLGNSAGESRFQAMGTLGLQEQTLTNNKHNDTNRRVSTRRHRKPKHSAINKLDEDLINDLLPNSATDESIKKSDRIKRRTRSEKQESRSEKSRREKSESKVMNEFLTDDEERLENSEKTVASSKDEKSKEAEADNTSKQVASSNVVKIPIKTLAVLIEMHLFWWFVQLLIFVWITTKVDWKLRVRTPIKEYPGYTAPRMPWLPGQLSMRDRLMAVWLTLAFLYLPAILYHMSKFFDRMPKAHLRKTLSRLPEKKPWYLHERYTRLHEPKEGQPLTFVIFVISVTLWIFYIFIFLSKFTQFLHFLLIVILTDLSTTTSIW